MLIAFIIQLTYYCCSAFVSTLFLFQLHNQSLWQFGFSKKQMPRLDYMSKRFTGSSTYGVGTGRESPHTVVQKMIAGKG
jgi:hypothetical protein